MPKRILFHQIRPQSFGIRNLKGTTRWIQFPNKTDNSWYLLWVFATHTYVVAKLLSAFAEGRYLLSVASVGQSVRDRCLEGKYRSKLLQTLKGRVGRSELTWVPVDLLDQYWLRYWSFIVGYNLGFWLKVWLDYSAILFAWNSFIDECWRICCQNF